MTFRQLGEVFEKHPDRISNNAGLPLRVISGRRTDLMMLHYFRRVAGEKIAGLQREYPASSFAANAEKVRSALRNTYLMPPTPTAPVQAVRARAVHVDGVDVEQQLLQLQPGVYSTSWIYKPPAQKGTARNGRRPAILMLPGHGDPGWSPAVQSRCLGFAKQGYLVMLVEPFGQDERGEMPLYNESHDSQAAAFLMVTGQSLLGLIMADHQAELTWLCGRDDVDRERIAVTGVSMGGTHSLWLAAIDTRIKACVPDAAAPVASLDWGMRHHGLCDLMVGLYDVGYDEMIRALIAPRHYLEIIPDVQRPVSAEAVRLLDEGWINAEDAVKQHALTQDQVARQHRYSLEVYARMNAADRYKELVVPGPHDYTKGMREIAAGWLGRFLMGAKDASPLPEPALAPITDRIQAIQMLAFWPEGKKPHDMLTPTAYLQREAARLVGELPPPPSDLRASEGLMGGLRRRVTGLLKTPLDSPNARLRELGELSTGGAKARKLIVVPEDGIELPMVLFSPAAQSKPNGVLHVLLHLNGMSHTAASPKQKTLSAQGAWVLCVDLRGMGETAYGQESGMYLGFRDYDLCAAALKLGNTQAGFWTKDLLAAVDAARGLIPGNVKVIVHGDHELGLIAILAAIHTSRIDAVETTGLLASYHSDEGYGLPYAYSGKDNDKSVTSRPLGGYGSMVPCIPGVLRHADIPQLAALVAPRPLTISRPLCASGKPVRSEDLDRQFAWTRQAYHLHNADKALKITDRDAERSRQASVRRQI
jgi:dienelactone hydrolase